MAFISILLLVLFFAADSFAVHAEIPAETQAAAKDSTRITLGGDIRVRGWYFKDRSDTAQQNTTDQTVQEEHPGKSPVQPIKSQTGK